MEDEAERGLSFGAGASVVAVIALLVLVSLPRLQAFALEENETDAAALTRVLGRALAEERAAPPSLAGLVEEAGLDPGHDDLEWLEGGRLLRRHGYLFELSAHPAGAALAAWPWTYGDTGRAAFVFRCDQGMLRHGNPSGAWTGPGRSPAGLGPGWVAVADELEAPPF
jgi:hypothetical protein